MIPSANWEQGNLPVTFKELLFTFSVNWDNVAFSQWSDNIPVINRSFNGFKIDLSDNFNILIKRVHEPTLLTSRDFTIFKISESSMLTFNVNLLLSFFQDHWFAKIALKWLQNCLQYDYLRTEEVYLLLVFQIGRRFGDTTVSLPIQFLVK